MTSELPQNCMSEAVKYRAIKYDHEFIKRIVVLLNASDISLKDKTFLIYP